MKPFRSEGARTVWGRWQFATCRSLLSWSPEPALRGEGYLVENCFSSSRWLDILLTWQTPPFPNFENEQVVRYILEFLTCRAIQSTFLKLLSNTAIHIWISRNRARLVSQKLCSANGKDRNWSRWLWTVYTCLERWSFITLRLVLANCAPSSIISRLFLRITTIRGVDLRRHDQLNGGFVLN